MSNKRLYGFLYLLIMLLSVSQLAATQDTYQWCPKCATFAHKETTAEEPYIMVDIPKNSSCIQIVQKLYRKGLLHDPLYFCTYLLRTGTWKKLKAGRYRLNPHLSSPGLVQILTEGKVILHKICIPEGLTVRAITQMIKNHPCLTHDIAAVPSEGSLLPGTYIFQTGHTRQYLIERMQNAMQLILEDVYPRAAPAIRKHLSSYEFLILASIVEKETNIAREKPIIAGVFLNRLGRKMRLQADPTVIYGITNGQGRLHRKLTRADWLKDSQYNTYTRLGLPPTPICCPGELTLQAVSKAEKNKYLYFVAEPFSGGHAFSKNLQEHNAHVARARSAQASR